MATERKQRAGRDVARVRAERDGFQRSAALRMEPPTTTEIWSRMPSSRRRWSTAASASSIRMPTLSRMRVGAARCRHGSRRCK